MADLQTIDARRVSAVLADCLFRDNEMPDADTVPAGAVEVEGVLHRYAFHAERLNGHRAEIASMLAALPDAFQRRGGGGMSFLNACEDRSGALWGQHIDIERLIALGQAVGAASYPLPREMWSILPGGMPYVTVDPDAANPSPQPRSDKEGG